MHTEANGPLVDRLARYDHLIEVGVGRRPDVAAALAARGRTVTATDVRGRDVPDGVRFVRDDVTDPEPSVYRGADAVYARNCPPELQAPLADVAREADAACLVTTLGTDPIVVDATPETLPDRTLHRVHA
ncbi:hypothetical protein BRD11_05925 [Halobacteriales archaeon SW_12_69_24]|nr:MAG: hypothetical protein BRD11_05925 [Halobacteriales archaeon SW_12_69_24]